ncbi:MAG: hypothetical protein MZV70_15760 [Desulfobacterales bacterium]|nr:hypothetical protein [Desulfobacterales bacterium]
MLDAKLDAIERSGADVVVATDVSCLMHIGGGLHRRGSRGARAAHRRGAGGTRAMTEAALAFHRRIDAALADARLRQALALDDRAPRRRARRRRSARWPTPRPAATQARRARADAIARLDSHLDQFAREADGPRLHGALGGNRRRRAADHHRHRRASAASALAVKSKSMATEEVELNEALEHAGVRVVETDLGEFVVQLGGDRPSHIITPIIHRQPAGRRRALPGEARRRRRRTSRTSRP